MSCFPAAVGGHIVEESKKICLKPEKKVVYICVQAVEIFIKWTYFVETVGPPGALQCSVVMDRGELSQGLITPAEFWCCGTEPKV